MRVLFVSPHPDDFIMCAGGALLKHKDAGDEIGLILVSECEHLERNAGIREETDALINVMELDEVDRLDVENMIMWTPENRVRVRRVLEHWRKEWNPDIVYCPWMEDVHQDHETIAAEVFRMFRYATILQWGHPHSCIGFPADYYVAFDTDTAYRKIGLLNIFKSQGGTPYFDLGYVERLMRSAGDEVMVPYAERFKVRRIVT